MGTNIMENIDNWIEISDTRNYNGSIWTMEDEKVEVEDIFWEDMNGTGETAKGELSMKYET